MADFENSGFESAAEEGVLGEALGWTWDAIQAVGEFARFNESALDLYTRPTEVFEGWWKVPWSLDYADAAARLAATGFTANDVGVVAIQRDENSLWRLTTHSPIAWTEIATDFNQWWLDSFDEGTAVDAVFTVSDDVEDVESFTIWDGPIWKDSWSETPAAFGTWFDEGAGAIVRGVSIERFDDGWGASLFATAARWVPAMDERLVGDALTFPVTIPPGQNFIWVYRDLWNDVVELQLDAGEYDSAATLSAHIQSKWWAANASGANTVLRWSFEGDSIVFEWNGSLGSEHVAFCYPVSKQSSDARQFIGFDSFGPSGTQSILLMMAGWLDSVPTGTDDDEEFWIDQWAALGVVGDYHADVGGAFARPWGQIRAIFDSGVTVLETLTFTEWFAESWKDALLDVDITLAAFETESGSATVESFEDSWADYQ